MPDLKTELTTKVLPVINNLDELSFEDNDKETDSVVKQVFDCVKQYGPCTAGFVGSKLNLEPNNIHVRLRSLLDRGFLQRADSTAGYLYVAIQKEYKVMSSAERVAKMNERRQALKDAGLLKRRKKKKDAAPAARRHDVMSYPTPKAPPTPAADDMETFINSLTVADAIKLRNKLNEMFGLS